MDSDSFSTDYYYCCDEHRMIYFALCEYYEKDATFNFTVKKTDCEFNGTRAYLVDAATNYRIRIHDMSKKGIIEAAERFAEGFKNKTLYKHMC
jgi:hypothetical protein